VAKGARKIIPGFAWQPRYHDHLIRDEREYQRIARYIRKILPIGWIGSGRVMIIRGDAKFWWLLKDKRITSVLIGASSPAQLLDSLLCLSTPDFSQDELGSFESILSNG